MIFRIPTNYHDSFVLVGGEIHDEDKPSDKEVAAMIFELLYSRLSSNVMDEFHKFYQDYRDSPGDVNYSYLIDTAWKCKR